DDAAPGAGHALVRADLSLLRETARAADDITRHTDRLDAVVLCAGVLSPWRSGPTRTSSAASR
ncbi:MAG TPA: hypothetical protein VFR67_15975, partial [Pilimelia sp.]|nr:hypothetical protein [Pilimelia sp.]